MSLLGFIIYSVHKLRTDIAEEEKLLLDLVVTGTKLVSTIEEIVSGTERLSSVSGNP